MEQQRPSPLSGFSPVQLFVGGIIAGVLVLCTIGFFILLSGKGIALGGPNRNAVVQDPGNAAPNQPAQQAPQTPAVVRGDVVDDDPMIGSAKAPVTIIEFSDFQCPFCARFATETLPPLKSTYLTTGKARLIFRDLPLVQIHPYARGAAIAAECAKKQGKDAMYFRYHDKLFENQS
ncbi:MAG: thioredoxin domain-containing protein, partial [Patescibacteria group bacterium]